MFRARCLLILIGTTLWLLHISEGYSATVSFSPGPQIYMTGTSSDVFFDVYDDIVVNVPSVSATRPILSTGDLKFSGAFYIKNIGWALMSSGSLQVSLNCWPQDIHSLMSDCQLSGSGWSEMVWEVGFDNVVYEYASGTLSGSIHTFAGDFSVDGVLLPLRPAEIAESLVGLKTNHVTQFTIKESEKYGDGVWTFTIKPWKNPAFENRTSLPHTIDLSLADTYTFIITDPSGSETTYTDITVASDIPSEILDSDPNYFIANFCNSNPSSCPDGVSPSPTDLQAIPPANTYADGKHFYSHRLKLRDKYGNAITEWEVEVVYTGSVSAVQTDIMNPYTNFSHFHDAIVFSWVTATQSWTSELWSFDATLNWQDIIYDIGSIAPTDSTDNIIQLKEIHYADSSNSKTTINITPWALTFEKPVDFSITPPSDIQIGWTSIFTGNLTNHSTDITPDGTILAIIGNGIISEFLSPQISHPDGCTSIDSWCQWSYMWVGTSGTASGSEFSLSAIYTPHIAQPTVEEISVDGFVHYKATGNLGTSYDVIYQATSRTQNSTFKPSRVKILGQNNAGSQYGTVTTSKNTRSTLINTIRKNAALMSRNRPNYYSVPYTITNWGLTVTDTTFDNKNSIIVIGGNVTIDENIDVRTDSPRAIIALADENGVGGNIIIKWVVTDIHATLIAEHAIVNTGSQDKQLYIHGSLISANTLGETIAKICPYFVTVTCDETEAAKYDLEEIRKNYDGTLTSLDPKWSQYRDHALIIEYDGRITSDPPPWLELQ